MKYGTSLRVRHLIGRLDKGEEFVEAIREVCKRERIKAASFQAIGVFSTAELQQFDPRAQKWVTHFTAETPLEAVSLTGNVSTLGTELIVNTAAVLSYSGFKQSHVVAGHLANAKVHVCEFTMVSYEDVTLERTYDAGTGLPLWNRVEANDHGGFADLSSGSASAESASESTDDGGAAPEVAESSRPKVAPQVIRRGTSAPTPEPVAPAVVTEKEPDSNRPAPKAAWDTAIKQTAAVKAREKLQIPEGGSATTSGGVDDDIMLKVGDILHHPTLGKCKVMRVEDEEWAHIRVGTGKIRKLALHLFDIVLKAEEDDHNVYKLKKRRTR